MPGLQEYNLGAVTTAPTPTEPAAPLAHDAPHWEAYEAVGDIIEFWGFKRVLGRIWMLLYLSPENLSAADIGAHLGLSTGAVSMALKDLEHWGIVIRASKPGSRQFYYRPEVSLWRMCSRVVKNREIHELEKLIQTLRAAKNAIEHTHGRGTPPSPRYLYAVKRLERLEKLVVLGSEALRLLFQERPLDLTTIQKVAQIRTLFQTSEGELK